LSDNPDMIPANPNAGPSYRVMRVVVIVLGVLMVLMFAAVVAGFFIKMKHDVPAGPGGAPAAFLLAPGARIVSEETSGDRVIIHVKTPGGDEIDIVDTESGRLVGQVKSTPAK
jgi:hypothetical protein